MNAIDQTFEERYRGGLNCKRSQRCHAERVSRDGEAKSRHSRRELSEFLGGGHQVVCVNSGTAALHLCPAGVQPVGTGDEVLLPSLTYVASFQAVTATGARPVACDIDPQSLTLNPEDMHAGGSRPAPKPSCRFTMPAVRGTVGRSCTEVAEQNGLRVVEDAAHAFGCRLGRPLGGFLGRLGLFQFRRHQEHHLR